MATVVHTTTHFLKRDKLYDTEKPYSLRFTPPDGFPRANIKLDKHDIDIHDVRKNAKNLIFERDGATVLDFESRMTYEDYDNDGTVRKVLLKEVANHLKTFLAAQHVQIFEHTVRSASCSKFLSSKSPCAQGKETTRDISNLHR